MPAIPFFDPETNGFVYHVEPDVHTFYSDGISDISSETESSESGRTIGSEDLPDYFVEHNGRLQPSGNAIWYFPTDNTRRFIIRHFVDSYIHGGNYAPIVKEMLPFEPGETHHVLELGTRDGTWAQEMATEFPHVQFLSLDVAPIMAHVPRPNVTFQICDFTKGLMLEDSSQDVVFFNGVFELVGDYRALLREAHRVLRPGGLIHIREFDLPLYDSQDPTKVAWRTHPICSRLLEALRNSLVRVGADVETLEQLSYWLAFEPNGEAGFGNIQIATKMFPGYPHESPVCGHKVDPRFAPYLEHFAVSSLRDMSSIISDGGMSMEDATKLIEDAIVELRRPGTCILFKLICMYAVKKDT